MSSAADTAQASQSARVKANFRASMTQESAMHGGLLEKRSSGIIKRWQWRYFSITGHYLRYSAAKGAPVQSAYDLNHITKAEIKERELVLEISVREAGARGGLIAIVNLRAATAEEAKKWFDVIVTFKPRHRPSELDLYRASLMDPFHRHKAPSVAKEPPMDSSTAQFAAPAAAASIETPSPRFHSPSLVQIRGNIAQLAEKGILKNVDAKAVAAMRHGFRALVSDKQRLYKKGTREWAFKAVLHWLLREDAPPPPVIFWFVGPPGMGKTVFSAELLRRLEVPLEPSREASPDDRERPWTMSSTMKDPLAGRLAAQHFFRHDDANSSDPLLLLRSLATQLCASVPGFEEALEKTRVAEAAPETAIETFDALLFEPLATLLLPHAAIIRQRVIILDALDELSQPQLGPVLDLITTCLAKRLPSWLRLVVTSRDTPTIKDKLLPTNPETASRTCCRRWCRRRCCCSGRRRWCWCCYVCVVLRAHLRAPGSALPLTVLPCFCVTDNPPPAGARG